MKTTASTFAFRFVLLLALVAAPAALAQRGSFELGGGVGLTSLDDKLGGDSGWSLGFRAGYFVTDRFEIEIQGEYASSILDGSFSAYTLNAVYYFDGGRRVRPYVLAGIGQAQVEIDGLFVAAIEDDRPALRVALGSRFEIGEAGSAFSRAELSALSEDSFDDNAIHVGVKFLFGWNFGS